MKPVSIIFLFCFLSLSAFSQTSTQGTDFWMTFGRSAYHEPSPVTLQIRIVATKTTTVKWSFTADTTLNFSVIIKAGEVYTRDLNKHERVAVYTYIHAKTNQSLHLQSDEPVSVYALAQHYSSTDATNILPVSNLGADYYHISYMPSFDDGFTAVAVEDSTIIYENGTPILINEGGTWVPEVLKAGEVLGHYYAYHDDITGTHISSNKPIAYFVINQAAMIPEETHSADCLYQQLMPVHTWGTRFLVPVSEQGIARIRVVASQDGTTFRKITGDIQTPEVEYLTLNKGKFTEWEITSSDHGCFISSDKPVGVASFMVGVHHIGLKRKMGDPSMTWIPPVEQTIDSVVIAPFIPSGNTLLKEHYALIITPTKNREATTMSVKGATTALTGGTWITSHEGYSYYSLLLTDSVNSSMFANPDSLLVLGYGLGPAESYYYLAGSAAINLNANFYMNDVSYQNIDGQEFCSPVSFRIRSEISYPLDKDSVGYLTWLIDDKVQPQAEDLKDWDWNQELSPGKHTITMRIRDTSKLTYEFSTTIIICDPSSLPIYKIPVNPQIKVGF
jgi:hypothetical protein